MSTPIELTIGHSPDPDDAFMWWPLGTPELEPSIDTGPFRFTPVADDIEKLNRRAIEVGDLDITACSVHTYAHIRERYMLTACGGSLGDGYGPRIIAREAQPESWLKTPGLRIAVPGTKTTAYLTLRLMLGADFEHVVMPFETITDAVRSGEVDAGVVIHEAQITYADLGLASIADLGDWWKRETGLPLPLGGNAVRRDIDDRFGPGTLARLADVLRASIEHAMTHREQGVRYALGFAQPGTGDAQADRFIGMYVNDLTLDLGTAGEQAMQRLLDQASDLGLAPAPGRIDPLRGRDGVPA
jgi:1,4-dihydroxy-6-naphthoate synthase